MTKDFDNHRQIFDRSDDLQGAAELGLGSSMELINSLHLLRNSILDPLIALLYLGPVSGQPAV